MACTSRLRSVGPLLDPDIVFPESEAFDEPSKLPTNKSIIGVIRHLTGRKYRHDQSVAEVAKRVYAKYFHDTVYCLPYRTINRRVQKLWDVFREGKKRYSSSSKGKERKVVGEYRELVENAEKLFDMYETNPSKRTDLKKEWGVGMSQREYNYYEDMKTTRKMECDHGVDPVWYASVMKRQRLKELSTESKKKQDEAFLFRNLNEIDELISGSESAESHSPHSSQSEAEEEILVEEPSTSKKRKFVAERDSSSQDPLPCQFRHIRDSERKVLDAVYYTCASLAGEGLSVNESVKAIVRVGNGLFGRQWKEFGDDDEQFDVNTMPHERNIREKMQLIETESLALLADEVKVQSDDGRMITHAIDSTTKQRVGSFATQGIHIGKNVPFPLPLLGICGETTEDIAMQVDFAFEVLAAAKKTTAAEIYKYIDTHMTDSVEHNKGFAELLADLYNLDTPAGQLFGGAHTTLGFSTAMNKMVSMVEGEMKMENILSHFIVDLDFDSKNGSFSGQALDMMLKFVAPEFDQKMWNYYKLFDNFLKNNEIKNVLFAYKDHRFGCLSRAAAVLLYNYEWLALFLQAHPQITNRLACLVRNLLELPYIKVVFTVFAAFGVHLVEPFYCRTIDTKATHSSLKIFYKNLYNSMSQEVSIEFFSFKKPHFPGISDGLFRGIIESYNEDVVNVVIENAEEHKSDVVKLANFILPELRTVLARQRKDYGLSDEFPEEYPVNEQASNVDDTPVHNLAMERQNATADYRLHKLKSLASVGRSMVLQRTTELRDGSGSTRTFRSFKEEMNRRREVELRWSKKMEEKFAAGANEKQVVAQNQERKRLNMMEELKLLGGPFTNEDEVKQVLQSSMDEKLKKKRMKMEIQFARDSSTTLPKVDQLFRIMKTLPNKKRRDKTPEEFAEALIAFLGKKTGKTAVAYEVFTDSLDKCYSFEK